MNDFAGAHHGIAPVAVVPDDLGSQLANPICTDSSLGQVDTYLSTDVPGIIGNRLRVDPNHEHWVIGGFSHGGKYRVAVGALHGQKDDVPHFGPVGVAYRRHQVACHVRRTARNLAARRRRIQYR